MQSILVTGAAKGIGRACVSHLAGLGHRVFAGVRSDADGAALREQLGERVIPLRLEVTDPLQIAQAAATIEARVGSAGLNGLVNNAGVAIAGPLEFLPIAELRRQLDINVVGQIAVTQAMLPLIRSARGRIVTIGSISGRSALPMTGAYAASKFALEALTDSLRVELRPWGIEVVIVEPGVITTPIWETSIAAAERIATQLPPRAIEYYGRIREGLKGKVRAGAAQGLAPERVAQVVEQALFSSKPKTRYVVGKDARKRLFLQRLPDRWRDALIAREMAKL